VSQIAGLGCSLTGLEPSGRRSTARWPWGITAVKPST